MSMWILREPGEKASSRPVTRSSKRAPMATITSQSCMALLASNEPCMPTMPSHCGSDAGKAPRPIRVEVTGAPVSAASSRSSSAALRARVDDPAAGVEDRPAGLGDHGHGLGDPAGSPLVRGA